MIVIDAAPPVFVIPAQAGIQLFAAMNEQLDPGLRRDDEEVAAMIAPCELHA